MKTKTFRVVVLMRAWNIVVGVCSIGPSSTTMITNVRVDDEKQRETYEVKRYRIMSPREMF